MQTIITGSIGPGLRGNSAFIANKVLETLRAKRDHGVF